MSDAEDIRDPLLLAVSSHAARCHGDWRRETLHASPHTDIGNFYVDLYGPNAVSFYVIISTHNCSTEVDMKTGYLTLLLW
jgi:hypothetical protein